LLNKLLTLAESRPLLLVVDDQSSNIQILYDIFKSECEVCMATNGADAIAFCMSRQPDLILLDVVMPDMGGYEVCQKLKSNPLTELIPVIFVTAQNDPDEEALGFDTGAVDFISKPFHVNVVKARVQTHLTLKFQSDLLRSMSLTDGLTGVANRRQFDTVLQNEWRSCMRQKQPLALIMIDVDFFKNYNDFYGHQAGDHCLQTLASALRINLVRSHDLLARYGGEEFAGILPNTPMEGAEQKAAQLEKFVRGLSIPHGKSAVADIVTISLGVAVTIPTREMDCTQLLSCADSQLYLAKLSGRATFKSQFLE